MRIEISHVSKSFKGQKVLNDVSLVIPDNEVFGLIGPSGAGKTTLIRLMMGAIGSDSGRICIGDTVMPDLGVLRNIGYMPQTDALYADLSGYDNLMFFGSMYEMSRHELKKRAEEVLGLTELLTDKSKRVDLYSGGMKKRLSLAVALLHNPGLLILDEPTVGIDPVLRKKIWDEFYRQKKLGRTIVITTHVMDEAVKCDRLGLIYGGGIIASDTVETLLARTKNNSIEELFFEKEAPLK